MNLLPFLLGFLAFAGPAHAAVERQESAPPVRLGDVTLSASTLLGSAPAAEMQGRLFVESRGTRSMALSRAGYALTYLDTADFGGGRVVVLGWTSGGTGRYLIPEVHRVTAPHGQPRLEKVWGPYEENPLYQGEMSIDRERGRLVLVDHLTSHSFVPPLLARSTAVVWKNGRFASLAPEFDRPSTVHQKANLGRELFLLGDVRESLRLYLEAVREGDEDLLKNDPDLGAALYFAVAEGYEKLGDRQAQREQLMKLADRYPDSELAREAADQLLKMRAGEMRGR